MQCYGTVRRSIMAGWFSLRSSNEIENGAVHGQNQLKSGPGVFFENSTTSGPVHSTKKIVQSSRVSIHQEGSVSDVPVLKPGPSLDIHLRKMKLFVVGTFLWTNKSYLYNASLRRQGSSVCLLCHILPNFCNALQTVQQSMVYDSICARALSHGLRCIC